MVHTLPSRLQPTLGVVKNRFRCIHRSGGELQYTPLRSAKIVSACLLLHNMCVSRSIPDLNNHLPKEDMPIEAHVVGAGDRGGTGRQTPDEIIPEFYGRKVSHVSGGSSKPAYVLSREEVKLNVRGKRVRWIQVVVPRYP
ncbi:hypothetical protein Pcinc_031474 [Petrolisthes cinctipes]|uniref:Nuclease HARBI1 n=1 Tax=Petrolisthes cinctipes TaxID=88211 RepID=A0AAE1EX11_PETCI|nr:hypothetical protein Pcinc_031474 [Petrolisthes cinctipes]